MAAAEGCLWMLGAAPQGEETVDTLHLTSRPARPPAKLINSRLQPSALSFSYCMWAACQP